MVRFVLSQFSGDFIKRFLSVVSRTLMSNLQVTSHSRVDGWRRGNRADKGKTGDELFEMHFSLKVFNGKETEWMATCLVRKNERWRLSRPLNTPARTSSRQWRMLPALFWSLTTAAGRIRELLVSASCHSPLILPHVPRLNPLIAEGYMGRLPVG